MTAGADPGAETYQAFVDAELAEQRAVKTSLEQRGAAVITSAGALVTLLFGLVALITGRTNYELPGSTHRFLYIALGLFVIAALLGLLIALPLVYRAATVPGLRSAVTNYWGDDKSRALQRVALTKINIIESYKAMNRYKGIALFTAISFEVAAVLSIAIVVGLILWNE